MEPSILPRKERKGKNGVERGRNVGQRLITYLISIGCRFSFLGGGALLLVEEFALFGAAPKDGHFVLDLLLDARLAPGKFDRRRSSRRLSCFAAAAAGIGTGGRVNGSLFDGRVFRPR